MRPKIMYLAKPTESVKLDIGKKFSITSNKSDAEVLYIHLNEVDKKFLNSFHNLRYIVCPCTGIAHIDLAAVADRGAQVVHLEPIDLVMKKVHATSELTFALILALARKIVIGSETALNSEIRKRDLLMGTELNGGVLGIIGVGRIGKQVATIARGFNMRVIGCDNHITQRKAFIEVLTQSDIVSLHIPLNEETKGMIGKDEIAMMKRSSYLINTSRDKIIDEDALVEAVTNNIIAGVGLDVYEGYSYDTRTFLKKQASEEGNVVLTPHIGGNTTTSRKTTDMVIFDKLINKMSKDKYCDWNNI